MKKRVSRDLAAEYIYLAISRDENLDYLATSIGILLSKSYAPINRFIEYLDRPTHFIEVIHFQYKVLTQFILQVESDSQPRNTKKMIQYYKEALNNLSIQIPAELEKKL